MSLTGLNGLAKQAYSAYGEATGNKNYQGNPMPTWEELPDSIRIAWAASTRKIIEIVYSPEMMSEVVSILKEGS